MEIRFFIFIASVSFIIVVSVFFHFFFKETKKYVTKQWYLFSSKAKQWYNKFLFLKRVAKELHFNFYSHSVEIVFQMFIHFYETNYRDIQKWEFDKDLFPNGRNDLMNLYKWIRKIRPENYGEVTSLDYDFANRCFTYWGSKYEGIKYRLTHTGELKIIPIDYVEAEHPDGVFQHKLIKMQNDLFNLDTEKCRWILERRRYLNI